MPIPSSIDQLSQTAASNYPAGSDSPSTLDDTQRAHASFIALLRDGKGHTNQVSLASATTTDIGGQNSQFVEVTGTTTITSFGSAYNGPRFLRFTGVLTLTHNSTTLNLPGATNINTAVGDTCIAVPNTALNGWNVVSYQRASGAGLSGGGGATGGGTDQIFWKNGQTITTDYTIAATENAGTFGPVTINTGVTVTVTTGATWTVV